MSIKAVIFDLDGTLVNSIEDLADSMNKVLVSHNLPVHQVEAYNQFVGHGIRTLVQRALPENKRTENFITACYDEMIAVYDDNCTNKTSAYKGIPELLNALTAKNITLAVFSNKAEAFTRRVVDVVLNNWAFSAVIGLTTEALKKPNPEKAISFCKALDLNPEEVLFVGDSGVDMQTGVRGGMQSVGVLWGFRDENELREKGAKHVIQNPMDLLPILV